MSRTEWMSKRKILKEQRYRDRETYLYHIPSRNYVGITVNLSRRMVEHKCNDTNIEGFNVLGVFPNKREALDAERIFHNLNCEGDAIRFRRYNKRDRK